jgi:riboflavin synthase
MFTGIVSEIGVVTQRSDENRSMRIVVRAPATSSGVSVGDSIAVNGVCLTAIDVTPDTFTVEAVAETLNRTSLGAIRAEDRVNLERPVPAMGRFDGHVVQGHIDGVATVASVDAEGESHRVRLVLPDDLSRYVVEKGSIALDGTSLTVTAVSAPGAPSSWVEVVLIPHTIDATALGSRSPGDRVNVEVDILAKYVERITEMNHDTA